MPTSLQRLAFILIGFQLKDHHGVILEDRNLVPSQYATQLLLPINATPKQPEESMDLQIIYSRQGFGLDSDLNTFEPTNVVVKMEPCCLTHFNEIVANKPNCHPIREASSSRLVFYKRIETKHDSTQYFCWQFALKSNSSIHLLPVQPSENVDNIGCPICTRNGSFRERIIGFNAYLNGMDSTLKPAERIYWRASKNRFVHRSTRSRFSVSQNNRDGVSIPSAVAQQRPQKKETRIMDAKCDLGLTTTDDDSDDHTQGKKQMKKQKKS